MEQKEQEPFDRESWRRLLGADTGAPTKEMDRRILAEARRALTPRIGRWWLPASLAASLLLAVLIVQWQFGDVGKPAAVTEADVLATTPAESARKNSASAEMETRKQRQDAPASAITSVPPPHVDLPNLQWSRVPAESAPAAAEAAPPPAAEPAKPAVEDQALLRNVTVTGARSATSAVTATPPPQAEGKADEAGALSDMMAKEAYADSRTPEQWYVDIEALRAAGRIKEADAELARFKSRYPDWLAQHHQKDP